MPAPPTGNGVEGFRVLGNCFWPITLNNPPKGILFHASGPIDGGWGVIDFWESRQDFDAFQSRIHESVAVSGVELQGPPDIKEFAVHETYRP